LLSPVTTVYLPYRIKLINATISFILITLQLAKDIDIASSLSWKPEMHTSFVSLDLDFNISILYKITV